MIADSKATYLKKTDCGVCGRTFDKEKEGVLADRWLCGDDCFKHYFSSQVNDIESKFEELEMDDQDDEYEQEKEEDIDVLDGL